MDLGLEKITKLPTKQKIALLVLILIAIGCALFFLLLKPKYKELKELEEKLDGLKTQIEENGKLAANLPVRIKDYERLQKDFQTQLAQLREGAEAEGRTVIGTTLQTLEPEQAKVFLLEMLDKQEMEDVVILMAAMDERRRAGILGEFQTPDEIAKIAEVLRLIRQGHPKAAIAEEVSQKINPQNAGAL